MDKQLVFTLFFLVGSAALVGAVAAFPALRRVYLAAFFFGVVKIVDVNYVSREEYRGWVRGYEIGTLDMLLIGLLAAIVLNAGRRRPRLLPPVFPAQLIYFAVAILASLTALVPLYASFGLLKLARELAVLWIVANSVIEEEDLRWLVWTSVALVAYESAVVARYYLGGVYRARGTFDHSNTLGMFLNLHLPIVLSFLLNTRPRGQWLLLGVFGAGAGAVVLTLSRGSWVALGLAIAIVVPVSLTLRLQPQKLGLIAVMALLAIPASIPAGMKMVQRIREAPESSGEARVTFNESARRMAADRVFGVGLNNYSWGTSETIYAEPFQGGLDEGGLCHNLYFLTLGEMGWPGLLALLGVIATAVARIGHFLLRHLSEDLRSVWMVGWLGGLAAIVLQATLEWAPRQTVLAFPIFGMLGVMAAIPHLRPGKRVARWRITVRAAMPAPAGAHP